VPAFNPVISKEPEVLAGLIVMLVQLVYEGGTAGG
jgi:hypothetical protein